MPKTSAQKAAISEKEMNQLLGGIITSISFNHARLTVRDMPVHGAEGFTEKRFVMEGVSGKHTLLVDATDLARLNAHWTVFASHHLNDLPRAICA